MIHDNGYYNKWDHNESNEWWYRHCKNNSACIKDIPTLNPFKVEMEYYQWLCSLVRMVIPHPGEPLQQEYLKVAFGHLFFAHLPAQVSYCNIFSYADDSTLLKATPTKDDRIAAAEELNADLRNVCSWGRRWSFYFEPNKCHSLCVSLKKDLDKHSPLFVDSLSIAEVDVLKILGIYFDRKLTWSSMNDQLAACSCQRLGAVFRARHHLGQSGFTIAFKSFVCPICEYSNVVLWEPQPPIYVNWILFRNRLRSCVVPSFHLWHLVATLVCSIGLLCKLQDLLCRDPLQSFCPALTSIQYPYSFRHVGDDDFLLQQLTQHNSLNLFINSFLGQIPSIWASIPLTLR